MANMKCGRPISGSGVPFPVSRFPFPVSSLRLPFEPAIFALIDYRMLYACLSALFPKIATERSRSSQNGIHIYIRIFSESRIRRNRNHSRSRSRNRCRIHFAVGRSSRQWVTAPHSLARSLSHTLWVSLSRLLLAKESRKMGEENGGN